MAVSAINSSQNKARKVDSSAASCSACSGIRHLRYTGKKSTIVVRGKETGNQSDVKKIVCERVLNSGEFAGQGYSYADDMIWRVAKGLSNAGTPSMWREWNMAHHLSQVVKDLGALSDMRFVEGPVSKIVEQFTLFAEQVEE